MMRSLPLASHGLVKEPVPLEFAGQSWCGSADAAGAVGAATLALAEGAGEGVACALALAAGVGGLASSLEHPKMAMAIANVTSVRIEISSETHTNRG